MAKISVELTKLPGRFSCRLCGPKCAPFATYQNAGVRAYDISNPYRPLETGALVPAAPEKMMDTRPARPRVIQSCDVFVDAQGIIYSTDYNGGLSVIEYLG